MQTCSISIQWTGFQLLNWKVIWEFFLRVPKTTVFYFLNNLNFSSTNEWDTTGYLIVYISSRFLSELIWWLNEALQLQDPQFCRQVLLMEILHLCILRTKVWSSSTRNNICTYWHKFSLVRILATNLVLFCDLQHCMLLFEFCHVMLLINNLILFRIFF